MKKKFSLACVDQKMPLRAWWAFIFVVPVSRRLVWFVVNYTRVTPNQITILAIGCRIAGIALFFCGNNKLTLFLGVLFVYFAYVLDYSDGAVARLKNLTSEFGRYLDHVSDLIGDICLLGALAFSHSMLFTKMCISMMFMHIAECYFSYLAGFSLQCSDISVKKNPILLMINNYRKWWFDRNMKSFLSFSDYTAFIFIFCPLVGEIQFGFSIGYFLLLATTCYTIFSTFISIHTDIKDFP